MSKIEEYKRYLKKCEMLGIKDFEFDNDAEDIVITKYIENDEPERLVKIPDFVNKIDMGAFGTVRQNLKVYANNINEINFMHYHGEKLDLSDLDISKINDMRQMFRWCVKIKEINVSNWDTSNITDMAYMFNRCDELKKLNLSNFNTSKVAFMGGMFSGCYELEELDISNFDTSKVIIRAINMFEGCSNLRLIKTNRRMRDWLERHRDTIKLNEYCQIIVR